MQYYPPGFLRWHVGFSLLHRCLAFLANPELDSTLGSSELGLAAVGIRKFLINSGSALFRARLSRSDFILSPLASKASHRIFDRVPHH